MRDNPRRGYDPVLVKAFINLIGVYPVGTSSFSTRSSSASWRRPIPSAALNRPLVRVGSMPTAERSRRRGRWWTSPSGTRAGTYLRTISRSPTPTLWPHGRRLLCLSPASRRLRRAARERPHGAHPLPDRRPSRPARSVAALRAAAERRRHRGRRSVQRSPGRRPHDPALHLRGAPAGRDARPVRSTSSPARSCACRSCSSATSTRCFATGVDRFLRDAERLGVAGLLLTDLPAGAIPARGGGSARAARPHPARRARPRRRAPGRTRSTGARDSSTWSAGWASRGEPRRSPPDLAGPVARRARGDPAAGRVGFGISTPEQARAVARTGRRRGGGQRAGGRLGPGVSTRPPRFLRSLRDAIDGAGAAMKVPVSRLLRALCPGCWSGGCCCAPVLASTGAGSPADPDVALAAMVLLRTAPVRLSKYSYLTQIGIPALVGAVTVGAAPVVAALGRTCSPTCCGCDVPGGRRGSMPARSSPS